MVLCEHVLIILSFLLFSQLTCDGEAEVTALAVSPSFLVLQFYLEPGLDVYDARTRRRLYRLEGHEYGGQCVEIMNDAILFSGSMDKTLRAWNLGYVWN